MEQQLIDALKKAEKPEDIDDVSKVMIVARVTSALTEMGEATKEYLDKVQQIYAKREMELKIGGFTLILNATDSIMNQKIGEPVQMCVLGSGSNVLKNVQQIIGKIHGQV